MTEIIQALQTNALLVCVVGLGFWRVLVALHKIDRRLVKVETLLEVPKPEDI